MSSSGKTSPFKLSQPPNLLRNQHLQHYDMSRIIEVRVKKDINTMFQGEGGEHLDEEAEADLCELQRQMLVFDSGEKVYGSRHKKNKSTKNGFDYTGKLTKNQVVQKCMILAGNEARKHSMGPKKKENQTQQIKKKQFAKNSARSSKSRSLSPPRDKSLE